MESHRTLSTPARVALFAAPLVLLVVALYIFVQADPMQRLTGNQPPVEDIAVERTVLSEDGISLHIVNGGPAPVTIAQVQVDEAYWTFSISPSNTVPRLGRAVVSIPYHWVEGELHEVRLLTRTGVTFDHTIEVALATPSPDGGRWFLLGLLGFFVGIVPVGLGLMWFPLLQSVRKTALDFVLALTIGLLLFLFVDTLVEAIELAGDVAEVFQALPLVVLIAALSFGLLTAVGKRPGVRDRSTQNGRLWLATAIAIGIGLHNLGEGMAVGASIAAGEAALGSFLVIGFVLHNVTEGVGIGAPMAVDRPGFGRLALLVVVAGAPAIVGAWIGGFSYSPLLAVVFFSVGAGAILQVVVEVGRLISKGGEETGPAMNWLNLSGILTGVVIMYTTALLV